MSTSPVPVNLRASNLKFLSAEYGGGRDPRSLPPGSLALTASRDVAGPFEEFRLIPLTGDDLGMVAIQVSTGQYLTAEGGGGSFLRTDAREIGAWEKWTRVGFSTPMHDRTFCAFRAVDHLHYLSVEIPDPRGEVHAKKTAIGEWETFEVLGEAPAVVLLPLRRRGHCFEQADGMRWSGVECTEFHLFGRFANDEDIDPILEQRTDAGFDLFRVGTRYDLSPYGIGRCTLADHPFLYDQLVEFVRHCGSWGIRLEILSYFGREDFDPSHWARLGECLAGEPNVFLSLVNENDQVGNHIDLTPYHKHPGLLCSRGSNGSEQWPPDPRWDYAELHTNGASEEQRKVGHNAQELWDGPSWSSETSRYPDVGLWPRAGTIEKQCEMAYDSAAASTLLAAASGCFHSVAGKNSTRWDEPTERVARAWAQGAREVDLAWQDGGYVHRQDVETAMDPGGTSVLRVYQRGESPLVVVRCNTDERRATE